MKDYYFKIRKRGTRDHATTVYGITDPKAYQRQMKKNGYTVLEYGSLKPNWRQMQNNNAIEAVCDCTTCRADCSFAGKSKGIRILKNCHHYEEAKG